MLSVIPFNLPLCIYEALQTLRRLIHRSGPKVYSTGVPNTIIASPRMPRAADPLTLNDQPDCDRDLLHMLQRLESLRPSNDQNHHKDSTCEQLRTERIV